MGSTLESPKFIMARILAVYLLWDVCTAKTFPAVFVFGDSLVDVGNNFYIETTSRPTFPNGIDFGTGKASGRYTNGRTIPDIIEQKLGPGNFVPPYLAPIATGDITLKGVNYASSSSGIRRDVGNLFGAHISFEEQVDNLNKTKQDFMIRIGTTAARNLLKQSLYVIVTGGNDVMFGLISTSRDAYFDGLISIFKPQLIRLYHLGARKIVVTNMGCFGYIPLMRKIFLNNKSSIVSLNQAAQYYNTKLKSLLTELSTSLRGSVYVYADAYAILENIVQNGKKYGFENVDSGCCHLSGFGGGLATCASGCQVCNNRSKYLFWDSIHPTEAANLIIANHLMDGGLNYISPMNLRQLLNFPIN